MKHVIKIAATFALLFGGTLVLQDRAEACSNPFWTAGGGICQCRWGTWGYEQCLTNGNVCFIFQSGCGGGPGTIPV